MGIFSSNKPSLSSRVRALGEAADLAEGRSDDDVVAGAQRVVRQADRRLAFSGEVTVVALAGATGSGKSSTFNAISGTTLAEPGVTRPTTAKAMAASWGAEPPSELLDWLEIPRRHTVTGGADDLEGLVLVDLPDHDSTELAHRMEVDRLVQLVDMFIWVVDPQKYADAALHDRYLKPLVAHSGVMMVVLNQADTLSETELERCLTDLRRLLDSEGLKKAQLLAISAKTGRGVDTLRKKLSRAIADKQTAARRLSGDVDAAAAALTVEVGSAEPRPLGDARLKQLHRALGEAGGVPVVTEAVLKAVRHRGAAATGWPALSWLTKLRPDPLRRLHLDQFSSRSKKPNQLEPARVQRSSLPRGAGVQQARVDSALRALADDAAQGLPRGWSAAVLHASRREERLLADDLDRAVATTDLAMERGQGYWKLVQMLQWLLIAAVLVGLLWLGANFALGYFQLPRLPDVYSYRGITLPTMLVFGGVISGVLLALLSRLFVEFSAHRKAARAGSVLRESIAEVAEQRVVGPVNVELRRYSAARDALRRAH